MYLFYELMTLCSMPLVMHNGSREAIMAALKYLFYSMCGAYLGLFGIFFLYHYCDTLTFTAGGALNLSLVSGHEGILLIAVMAMLIGFGAKAGMFPLHAWLPAAHPVAPVPGVCGALGRHRKIGCARSPPCCLLHDRSGFSAWHLGAVGVAFSDADHSFHGIPACISGTGV